MTSELYEKIRTQLSGGHKPNPFGPLLQDRSGIRGPVQGTPEEFSQIVYELTAGDLNKKSRQMTYEVTAGGKKHLLKFSDGSLFVVVRAKSEVTGNIIVVTPFMPTMDELLNAHELTLAHLVSDGLKIRDAYAHVSGEYRRAERARAAEKAAEEHRIAKESTADIALATIEKARSGAVIMIRGIHNIDTLIRLGFVPSLIDNPDNWIDAEDVPGLRYHHERSGIEVLLIGREKFRPIEELNRLELYFLVIRSDGDPAVFGNMRRKFRETRQDGSAYPVREFHDDLIAMAKYPDELEGRTEEDLGLIANEVGHVIDRRQELDKGILPYEAVFARNTPTILDYIRANRTPVVEIRKALDYFEYTGMIDAKYRAQLDSEIRLAMAAGTAKMVKTADILQDARVKEIVLTVLKKIPKERLSPNMVTIALAPYASELGFGKLVKIRERILQLKAMMKE